MISRRVTGARGHSNPTVVDAVNSLSSGKGKGSWSPLDGCFLSAVQHIFKETAMPRKSTGNQSSGKGSQSKSWSKGEGKGKRMFRNLCLAFFSFQFSCFVIFFLLLFPFPLCCSIFIAALHAKHLLRRATALHSVGEKPLALIVVAMAQSRFVRKH